jgi:hypothetical protein
VDESKKNNGNGKRLATQQSVDQAVNSNKKPIVDTRTPEELMEIIAAKGKEVVDALASLRGKRKKSGYGVLYDKWRIS